MDTFDVVETSIAGLRDALDAGEVTSVELVVAYLERIARFDRSGPHLNSVPLLNPAVFDEASESDDRRISGVPRSPLDGVPYTVKDSYAVKGMTLAAGSPAFRELVADDDAFAVARLRAAGAVVLGRTTMPPMANGGMQRGLYGRAESPYNGDYLTAAFASGSSNGSGTATAASFCSFGLGEETWSSGRAPASNNGLVAYTPSRGIISVRGNWPLVPTMDVVVPHTRTVADLLELLDIVVADDPDPSGDFWRMQPWVDLPLASQTRPSSYRQLDVAGSLKGIRLGVPRMYINADDGVAEPIETRPAVLSLWEVARAELVTLGAEVVEVDFPVVSNYERDRPGALSMVDRGLVPDEFEEHEMWDLAMLWWDSFLKSYAAAGPPSLAEVDGSLIFPAAPGSLPDRYGEPDLDLADYVTRAKEGLLGLDEIPSLAEGARGLEEVRRIDFEDWLAGAGLDGVVLPAVADVGPADADTNTASADLAWRNGTWVANGNLVWRHLGIPTVTVPMGQMADIAMPVGLTLAGPAYSDARLLSWAAEFDAMRSRRVVPPRTPRCAAGPRARRSGRGRRLPGPRPELRLEAEATGSALGEAITIRVSLQVSPAHPLEHVRVSVNGEEVALEESGDGRYATTVTVRGADHQSRASDWWEPSGSMVIGYARDATGADAGAYCEVAAL